MKIQITHYLEEEGSIYYQALYHQRKILDIVEGFDIIIRSELPSIKSVIPDYSNKDLVKKRLTESACIFAAQYSMDDKYYRAELLEFVDNDKVK